jgi:methyl-accepting chemotaxis protein
VESVAGSVLAIVPAALRRSLIAKFVTVLVVLALVVGAVGFVGTEEIRAQTADNVEREFEGVAQSKATLVAEWYQQNRQVAGLVSENDAWTGSAGDEMRQRLVAERSALRNDVNALHVVEAGGQEPAKVATTVSNGRVPAPLLSWVAGQQFGQVSRVTVSPPYKSGGENVVAFVSPVGAGQGRLFVVEVGFASLSKTLRTSGSTLSNVQVVNPQNTIVAAQSGGETSAGVVGAQYASGSALQPVKRARTLRDSEDSAGVIGRLPGTSKVIEEPYTAGYAPVPSTDWVVVVHAPRAQLFGFVQTVSNLGMFASAGLVLLVAGVGVGLGYSVTSAINRLAGKAEEMEEGDLSVDLSTDRVDEIGQLYRSFASMRDEVRQRILDEQEAREEAEAAREETREVKSDVRELANHLERKAEEYSSVMQTCAGGDLTQRLDSQSKSKAMREIGTEFNEMVAELEAAIDQTTDFAEEVVAQSEVVMEGAESVDDASEQVARSVQQISDEAAEQRARIESIAEDLHAVAGTLDDLPEGRHETDLRRQVGVVERLCEEIDEVAAFSEETLAEAENVAAAAEEQTSALTEVSQSATDLHEYAAPLGDELDQFTTDADAEFRFGQVTPAEEE